MAPITESRPMPAVSPQALNRLVLPFYEKHSPLPNLMMMVLGLAVGNLWIRRHAKMLAKWQERPRETPRERPTLILETA